MKQNGMMFHEEWSKKDAEIERLRELVIGNADNEATEYPKLRQVLSLDNPPQ